MQRHCAVWLGLLLTTLAGCANSLPEQTTALMPRWPTAPATTEADTLQIEIALIRQPLSEPYINKEIWREVDELKLPLERRLMLEANGYRAGIISGNVPGDLQKLLTSKKTCVRSRRITLRNGNEHFLELAPGERQLVLHVVEQGDHLVQDFADAVCGLALQLELDDSGGMRVKCEPRVRHGQALRLMKPAEDRSGWTLRSGKPEEKYPSLAWELTLSTTEYGIVGGLLDREQSLGYQSFVQGTEAEAHQFLLVLRTVPPQLEAATAVLNAGNKPASKEPPPLAQQSVLQPKLPPSSPRGQSP
jgi:hypothetical protein